MPQTVTDEAYWAQIRAELAPETDVIAVALHVDSDEHRRRVTDDVEAPGALKWRLGKFESFRTAAWIRMTQPLTF